MVEAECACRLSSLYLPPPHRVTGGLCQRMCLANLAFFFQNISAAEEKPFPPQARDGKARIHGGDEPKPDGLSPSLRRPLRRGTVCLKKIKGSGGFCKRLLPCLSVLIPLDKGVGLPLRVSLATLSLRRASVLGCFKNANSFTRAPRLSGHPCLYIGLLFSIFYRRYSADRR